VTIKDIKQQGNVVDKMNAEMERRSAAWHDELRNMLLHTLEDLASKRVSIIRILEKDSVIGSSRR
jgi:hypothetical protein